jgi:catechol 2,3-dioxygenase-like lactoylglutathione lyase family enzyme
MNYIVSGIQQVGIGVANVHEAWKWYRQFFGVDVPVFDEAAIAGLMLPYTGGQPQARHAILALNMQGGGGFEIWQYTQRTPQAPAFDIQLGDTGIFAIKIKTFDIDKTFDYYKKNGVNCLTDIIHDPVKTKQFWIKDPYGNIFQIIEKKDFFQQSGYLTGGVFGVVIGTTQIQKTRSLFQDILHYDEKAYESTNVFHDFKFLPGGNVPCERILLRHKQPRSGAFSRLLGSTEIELVQVYTREPKKVFQNRYWGDLGYIHLCFDVNGMEALKNTCHTEGYTFTVDSANSFDMGEAAGRFAYIEDADGTLIEFVETHKVPIMKKIGWYLNLQKRKPEKPLPDFMIKAMSMNRVKTV